MDNEKIKNKVEELKEKIKELEKELKENSYKKADITKVALDFGLITLIGKNKSQLYVNEDNTFFYKKHECQNSKGILYLKPIEAKDIKKGMCIEFNDNYYFVQKVSDDIITLHLDSEGNLRDYFIDKNLRFNQVVKESDLVDWENKVSIPKFLYKLPYEYYRD